MLITLFQRPSGRPQTLDITHVRDEDELYFETNGVHISMEELAENQYAIYGDYGAKNEDGEPEEITVISNGRSCEECLTELRQLIEKAKAQ